MLNALSAGDEILTISGIHGKIITVLDDGNLIVEIAPKINVKLARKGVSGKVAPTITPAPAKEAPAKKKNSKKKGDSGNGNDSDSNNNSNDTSDESDK